VTPRIAIVQEWLITLGGSELVLRELLRIFPEADVFTLVDRMAPADRQFLGVGRTTTSFLNRIPGIERRYRSLLPLFPMAVRSLDVRDYDIVISNSHAVAKGVRTHDRQIHLCYCLSPMRYAWDLREQYLREAGLASGPKGALARGILEALRRWDKANSPGVRAFATLSHFIGDRIKRAYGRPSRVIYPPVDTAFYVPRNETAPPPAQYYVTAGRFVPYKRTDLIASAFRLLPDRQLVIVGDGPDAEKVREASGPNVTRTGRVDRERLRSLLQNATAFIFAAEEDFGIAPVEAQAAGIPVIAYARGGATETVIGTGGPESTGLFFEEQSDEAIAAAVRRFENLNKPIDPAACRANAERFAEERFRREFAAFVEEEWARFLLGADSNQHGGHSELSEGPATRPVRL
jgi:glycosyltransferase involved in cell wall biosynthesis